MSNQIEGLVKGLVLGGIIGAAVALLYAPQSGRKTREDIAGKAEDLLKKAKKEYEETLKKSEKAYDSAVKQLKHLESTTMEKAGQMEQKVEELAKLGKEALQDTKSDLTKAVTGAVQAFK